MILNTAMDIIEVAKFCIIRGVSNFGELKKSIRDFSYGCLAFQKTSPMPETNFVRYKAFTGVQTYPKILTLPESRIDWMEENFDELADQIASLALLMKRGQTKAAQDTDKL